MTFNRTQRILLTAGIGIVLLACTGCAVRNVDVADGFAPASIRQVSLRPAPVDDDNTYHTSIFNDRMAKAVTSELGQRGIAIVDKSPDVVATWRLDVDAGGQKIRRRDLHQKYWRHHYGIDYHQTSDRAWPVGMLIIDLVDPKDPDRLLWRGWEELILTEPAISDKTIRQAVSRICRGLDKR